MCDSCIIGASDLPGIFNGSLNTNSYLYCPLSSELPWKLAVTGNKASSSKNVTCSVLVVLSPWEIKHLSFWSYNFFNRGEGHGSGCTTVLSRMHRYLAKSFTLLSVSGKLAIFILAALVSLHYNRYKNIVKLAIFIISYLH